MQLKHKREYHIPEGSYKVSDRHSDAVVYVNDRYDRFEAMGFSGKAQKPAFYFTYRKPEARERKIRSFSSRGNGRSPTRQSARQSAWPSAAWRRRSGDLLKRSWGYDQTNIDYWQVTALIGKTMVEIRPLAQEVTAWDGYDRGRCAPLPGKFTGPAERRVAKDGQVKINHYAWAWRIGTEIEGVRDIRRIQVSAATTERFSTRGHSQRVPEGRQPAGDRHIGDQINA